MASRWCVAPEPPAGADGESRPVPSKAQNIGTASKRRGSMPSIEGTPETIFCVIPPLINPLGLNTTASAGAAGSTAEPQPQRRLSTFVGRAFV